jgi:hypothetical protein
MTKRYLPLLLVCACEGLTSAPQPLVSALVHTSDGCFALMTPNTPVSSTLGVADLCTYRAGSQLIAGIDLVELVIDYGPDVGFADTTTAPPPNVTVTVDGAAIDVDLSLSYEHRVGDRAYFVATFHAPATPSNDVQISAGVNSGFSTTIPIVFSTIAPQVELDMIDCMPGQPCELAGAVGDAHVRIVLPGLVPTSVQLHEQLGGIVQPDPIPPATTAISGDHTETTVSVPVPAAPDGTLLVLYTSVANGAPGSASATIRTPQLAAHLSCEPSCDLAAGDSVGLEIDAPALIRPPQAAVDTRINGTPALVGAAVALSPQATGLAVGTLALQAPSTPGTWQIDVSVAGYAAPAVITTVH